MDNNEYRKLCADFWQTLHAYNYAMTVVFNNDLISEDEARRRLKRLFCYTYRQLFGQKWYKKKDKHFPFIGFIEQGYSRANTHCHLAIEIPKEFVEQFELLVHLKAPKINPKMKIHIKPMESAGWLRYIVKEVTKDNNSFIYYKDFH